MGEDVVQRLAPEIREDLVRLVAAGRVNLLLGAGASADSNSPNGLQPPLGRQLAEEIREHFGFEDELPLSSLANRINRDDEKALSLYDFLRARLRGCRAANYYAHLVELRWSAIWTLNVDDVVENAYTRFRSAQQAKSFHFEDEPDYFRDQVPIVHLHGRVAEDRPERVVFSTTEYVRVASARPRWHAEFGNAWLEQPFIVVGASLVDEYDMQTFLDTNAAGGSPRIFVTPSISEEASADLRGLGFVVVVASSADFFESLSQEVRQWTGGISDPAAHALLTPLLREFSTVSQLGSATVPVGHDLLAGHRPLVQDVVRGLHVPVSWQSDLVDLVEDKLRDDKSSVVLAEGDSLSGKTLGLWVAAHELEKRGHVVLVHGESEVRDWTATRRALARLRRVVIFTDSISRFARLFAQVVDRSPGDHTVVVVGAFRTERFQFVSTLLTRTSFDVGDIVQNQLSAVDAEKIDDVLDSRALLNRIQDWRPQDRRALYLDEGLFGALYRTTHSASFVERIAEELPADDRLNALIAVACILDGYELGLPSGLVRNLGIDDSDEVFGSLFGDQGSLRRLNFAPILEVAIRRKVESSALRDLIEEILPVVAAGTNEATIRSGAISAEIAKALVRFMTLREWLGLHGAVELLENAAVYLDWDGGYWEQRSKAARGLGEFLDAERFAAKAAGQLPDTRRLATLGKQRLWRCAKDPSLELPERIELLHLALENLEESARASDTNPVPVIEALRGLSDFAALYAGSMGSGDLVDLSFKWNGWWAKAHEEGITSMTRFPDQIARYEGRWRHALDLDEPAGAMAAHESQEDVEDGVLKFFDSSRGFGFASVDDGDDVFLHASAFRGDAAEELYSGRRVRLTMTETRRGRKALQVWVSDHS